MYLGDENYWRGKYSIEKILSKEENGEYTAS